MRTLHVDATDSKGRNVDVRTLHVDGFHDEDSDAYLGFDVETARRQFARIAWAARHLHVEVIGRSHLPPGAAVVVANHGFGWDVAFAMAEVFRTTGRPLWALGDHVWWKVPYLRRIAAACGTVDGTRANVDRLLGDGELVLVLPGGIREAVKPRELRYQLLWGHRYGFIEAAIRNQAPVVPLATIGSDELFDFVGNAYRRGERLLRRVGLGKVPIPLPARILPIPHLVHLRYVFGEPIQPPSREAVAKDPTLVKRMRHEVAGALHELIEIELARRVGIEL